MNLSLLRQNNHVRRCSALDPRHSQRRELLDIIEGYYLAYAISRFHKHGLFQRLTAGVTSRELALAFHYDDEVIEALLEFLYQRITLLRRENQSDPLNF
jgi:hypothetical protein